MCSHTQHNKPNNLAFAIRDATTDIRGVIDTLHDIRAGQCPTRQHAQPHQGHTHPT